MRAYLERLQAGADKFIGQKAIMREFGVIIRDAAMEINHEFTASRDARKIAWGNADRPAQFCALTLYIRLRDGRPIIRWIRRKRRNGQLIVSTEVKSQNIRTYTTELDHDLVMKAERELEALRTVWRSLVKSRYAAVAVMNSLAKVGVSRPVDDLDEAEEFPLLGEAAENAKAKQKKAAAKNHVIPEQTYWDFNTTPKRRKSSFVGPGHQKPILKEEYQP